MRKLILAAAAFAAIATPASAGYYGHYNTYNYYAPKIICHFVQVPVYGYYGVTYVAKKVCKTVY